MGYIDAHHLGCNEYIALLHGKHPHTYWPPLIRDAYAMVMSYYNKDQGTDKFIELSFVNITHFSAVMHPQNPSHWSKWMFPWRSLQMLMLFLCVTYKQLILLTFIE
jgi:hypothetical protein